MDSTVRVEPAAQRDASADPNAAERLAALAYDDMRRVDALILERLDSHVALIPELSRYLIEAGGKRVRPMITVAAANMLGPCEQPPVLLAAAVEFIHTATLLHDDVVDESGMRRGKVAANLVWSNASSVLVGDFLFARSFSLMVEAGSMKALGVLSAAASTIAEGEVRQLSAVKDLGVSVETYMEIIDAKTAALFAAAAEVAGIVAGRPLVEEEALRTYGRELGLAFQLVDDALDYGGAASKLGKSVGDDFREGKVTLPVALCLQAARVTRPRSGNAPSPKPTSVKAISSRRWPISRATDHCGPRSTRPVTTPAGRVRLWRFSRTMPGAARWAIWPTSSSSAPTDRCPARPRQPVGGCDGGQKRRHRR